MKARWVLLVVLIELGTAAHGWAAGGERDLYLLGVALDQNGEAGGWERVGAEGAWKAARAGAILKDQLFTAETDGALRATTLAGGERKPNGKRDFKNTSFLFPIGDKLYGVETGGSLYRVDPGDGGRVRIGADGALKGTRAGAILKDQLYTANAVGALVATNLDNGHPKQIGKTEFGDTTFMFADRDKLYTIETDGSLYQIDAGDGGWERVGKEGAWKAVLAGAVFNNRLYTAERDGSLQATNLANGRRQQIGKAEFGNTTLMFAGTDEIYTVETDGSLYRVFVKPRESIDSYDWCPEEIEKVFREQGKAFYDHFHPRLLLGDKTTHAGVLDGLAWLRENTTKNDLVVMYVGCHGFADPKKGWGVETADGQTLWGREIKTELGKLPCQVLLMIETCTSGEFTHAHEDDPPVPSNVTALCACSGKQSTDNQLDIAVAEALYGRADFNQDGVVDLDELIRYIKQRYKEWWPEPKKGEESQTPVLLKSKATPGSTPLTKASADLAAVVHDGGFYSALVEKQDGDQFHVHLLGWASKPGPYFLTNAVTRDCICLPAEGRPLLVEQNGQWYPARLLSQDGENYKVHYLGYKEDEVVTKDRIKYPFVGRPEE